MSWEESVKRLIEGTGLTMEQIQEALSSYMGNRACAPTIPTEDSESPRYSKTRMPYCCPVCNGTGLVSRPPGVAGDIYSWADNGTGPYRCRACEGTGIVWR